MRTQEKLHAGKEFARGVKQSSAKVSTIAPYSLSEMLDIMQMDLQADVSLFQQNLNKRIAAWKKTLLETYPESFKMDMFSIVDYCTTNGIACTLPMSSRYGVKAAALSRKLGYEIKSYPDPLFGKINTYHTDILHMVFNQGL